MSDTKISQREARRLRKLVDELQRDRERMRNRWAQDYAPGWIHIGSLTLSDESYARVDTARKLRHAVILVNDSGNSVRMYAERLP